MRQLPPYFRLSVPVVVGLVILGMSCNRLQFDRSLQMDESDWPTFGRDNLRSNVSSQLLTPPLATAWEHDITGGIGSGSPIVVDSFVIIGNLRGELYGINLFTGKRQGWINLGDAIEGAPVIDGNIVFAGVINSSETLIAYDLHEGKIRWRRSYGEIQVSLLFWENKLFFGTTGGKFYCVDQNKGDMVWEFQIPNNIHRKGIRSSAALANGLVLFGADDGNVYALDAETGKKRWTFSLNAPIAAPVSINGDRAFCGSLAGRFAVLSLSSGTLLWQIEEGASLYASPGYTENEVLLTTTSGFVLSCGMSDGSVLWRKQLGSVINTSPVVSGEVAFVGTLDKHLYALNTQSGEILWQADLPGRMKTTPALAKGRLIVATDSKEVIAWKGVTE
jgi:outer membrane protein assembly factor BamB